MGIIDFHAHAFPDEIAPRAIAALEAQGHEPARLDGRVASLLQSMDRAGVDVSVVCSIATRPGQFESIRRWSAQIAGPRLAPFPSVHPAAPDAPAEVRRLAADGFRGIKLHPYYQEFDLDEERLWPLYAAAAECGLIVLCHTGFDIAFPRVRKADPERILRVAEAFPSLRLVTSHAGAWQDWGEVRRLLVGRPIYMDISYSLEYLTAGQAREMLTAHPQEYLLFGTDSPWTDQGETIAAVRALKLGEEREQHILGRSARALLGIDPTPPTRP